MCMGNAIGRQDTEGHLRVACWPDTCDEIGVMIMHSQTTRDSLYFHRTVGRH